MKTFFIIIVLVFLNISLFGQSTGINTTSPNALLDISAVDIANPTDKEGLLIPRIDQFPATNPGAAQHSMLIYLTTQDGFNEPGFYYWNYDTVTPANSSWVFSFTIFDKINDLFDGKSDLTGVNDGSSIFLGIDAGAVDDSSDNKNTGVGYQVFFKNTSGSNNTAIGNFALKNNSTADSNTAVGWKSLLFNKTGTMNTALGSQSLTRNKVSEFNVAVGVFSQGRRLTENFNTSIGTHSLRYFVEGTLNTAIGYHSLKGGYKTFATLLGGFGKATGSGNTGVGGYSLKFVLDGDENTGVGTYAGNDIKQGLANVAIGHQALDSVVDGNRNVAIGFGVGQNTSDVIAYDNNVYIGGLSGAEIETSNNIFIGHQSGKNDINLGNTLFIENTNADADNALVYGEFDTNLVRVNGDFETEGLKVGDTNGAPLIKQIIKKTEVGYDIANIKPKTGLSVDFVVAGANVASANAATVHVSASKFLPRGLIIAWARVLSDGNVRVHFYNARVVPSPTILDPGAIRNDVDPVAMDFYITVIEE